MDISRRMFFQKLSSPDVKLHTIAVAITEIRAQFLLSSLRRCCTVTCGRNNTFIIEKKEKIVVCDNKTVRLTHIQLISMKELHKLRQ